MPSRQKAAACLLLLEVLNNDRDTRKGAKTRKWIGRRNSLGLFNLVKELAAEDTRGYKEMMRMRKEQVNKILGLVEPLILKERTNFGTSISPAQRLALTIRYLATGETFRSLHLQFRISRAAISYVIMEVCIFHGVYFYCLF